MFDLEIQFDMIGAGAQNTLSKRHPRPSVCGFFTSIGFDQWPGVRLIQDSREGGICPPSSSGFEHPAALSKGAYSKNSKESVMDAQPAVSPAPTFAPSAQQPTMRRLIKCRVNVKTAAGAKHHYTDLFPSTCDAVIDALDRFGIAKIKAAA